MAIIDRRGNTVDATDPVMPLTPNPDLAIKMACRLATTGSNIALSGLAAVDGVTPSAGDRILVKDQTDATQNGLYNASSGNWTRTVDTQDNSRWAQGMLVEVSAGATNLRALYTLSTANPIVLGTSAIVFASASSSLNPAFASLTVGASVPAAAGVLLTVNANTVTLPSKPTGSTVAYVAQLGGADGTITGLLIDSFGNGATAVYSGITLRRANGTAALPTALQSGDLIGLIGAHGHGSTIYPLGGPVNLRFNAREAWTDSRNGSSASIWVTPVGSAATSAVEAVRFQDDSSVLLVKDGIGATPFSGLVLKNSTAAAAGVQQYSGGLQLTGQGWQTNTGGSQTVDWRIYNQPVQGAANPTTSLVLQFQVNGGGYSTAASLNSPGVLNLATGLRIASAATAGNVLRGDGTNFISAQLGFSDLGGSIAAAQIPSATISYAKIQNVTAARLLGNPTGGAAAPSEISLGATLAFSGTALQTVALSGDVTSSANSFATTVAAIAGTTVSGTTGTTNVVFSGSPTIATPTITTSATVPLVIGGTGSGAALELRSTSGTGSGDLVKITGGTNGATRLATFLGSAGTIGFGSAAGAAAPSNTLVAISGNVTSVSGLVGSNTTYLHLVGADTTVPTLVMDGFAGGPNLFARRADGSAASKSQCVNTDTLFAFGVQGYASDSAYHTCAAIAFVALESFTGSAFGTKINFRASSTGGALNTNAFNVYGEGAIALNIDANPGAGLIYTNSASFMLRTKTSLTDGGGHGTTPTLGTNGPTGATTPTKWLPYDDNGTTRYVPAY